MTHLNPNEPTRRLLTDLLNNELPTPQSQNELRTIARAYDTDENLIKLLELITQLNENNE